MISIVIPLYNKENQIKLTLESVFKQTFEDYEVIVINDGSTDNSLEEVSKIKNNKLHVYSQENKGVSAARNRGVQYAKYEYVAFLDADDEWDIDFLDTIVKLIEAFPNCGVFASAYNLKDYEGKTISLILNKLPFKSNQGILSNYFEVAACSHPPICSSSVVVKKKSLIEIGGFPEGIKSGEDLLTWARLAVTNKIAYSRKQAAIINCPNNVKEREPRLNVKDDVVYKELLKLFNTANPEFKNQIKKYLGRWNEMRTSIFIDSGKRLKAFSPLFKVIKYRGINLKVFFLFFAIFLPSEWMKYLSIKLKKHIYDHKE